MGRVGKKEKAFTIEVSVAFLREGDEGQLPGISQPPLGYPSWNIHHPNGISPKVGISPSQACTQAGTYNRTGPRSVMHAHCNPPWGARPAGRSRAAPRTTRGRGWSRRVGGRELTSSMRPIRWESSYNTYQAMPMGICMTRLICIRSWRWPVRSCDGRPTRLWEYFLYLL